MDLVVERHGTVTSTMDLARERARAGAPDGTTIIAESMTGGRGTNGRAWHAPVGGLYLSIVLRDVRDVQLLTLALGNAVADVLEVAGLDPRLKWVNDVWVGGRKVAGILVEGESTGDRFDFLVAGIGINVNGHAASYPEALQGQATTVEDELGCDQCIPDLEAYLLDHVRQWVAKVREGRGGDIVAPFRERDALLGQAVTVVDGARQTSGTARGVDERGRLLVDGDGRLHTVASGTVRLASSGVV